MTGAAVNLRDRARSFVRSVATAASTAARKGKQLHHKLLVATLSAALGVPILIVAVAQLRPRPPLPDTLEVGTGYLLTAGPRSATEPVVRLTREKSGSLRLDPKFKRSVQVAEVWPVGQDVNVWVQDYLYRFKVEPHLIRWDLEGVRLAAGDIVGRGGVLPEFIERIAPERRANDPVIKARPILFDGIPAIAFRVRLNTDCPGEVSAADNDSFCLQWMSGSSQGSVQVNESEWIHLSYGDRVRIGPRTTLWIGHWPFSVRPSSNTTGTWEMMLREDFELYRGQRAFLRNSGLQGSIVVQDSVSRIDLWDLRTLYLGQHLPPTQWSPEQEDEYQLLIDSELICLDLQVANGRPVPQLRWMDPTHPGCHDYLNAAASAKPLSLTNTALDVYRRRVRSDRLVRDANRILSDGDFSRYPDALPFVFEWWLFGTGQAVQPVPVRLWGVRVMSTSHKGSLAPAAGEAVRTPTVSLRDSSGTLLQLATGRPRERQYLDAVWELGLGPVLGIRDVVDGLEEVVDLLPTSKPLAGVVLTIRPELQRSLWAALSSTLRPTQADAQGRRTHGVQAIAIRPSTGEILAAMSWPQALELENDFKDGRLSPALSGRVLPSRNTAMLRTENVGSVLKILTLYSMVGAGVFDRAPTPVSLPDVCNREQIGLLFTDPQFQVRPSSVKGLTDHQLGPLPVGPLGLAGGAPSATRTSCNAFFSYAATMLLAAPMPSVAYLKRCPVDARRQRMDRGAATLNQWIICRDWTLSAGRNSPSTWLLLPPGERLAERAQRGADANGSGFFGVAIDAGFHFLVRRPGAKRSSLVELPDYRGRPFRSDWFSEVPGAEGRIFEYPAMLSPASVFGGGSETYGNSPVQVESVGGWRDFATQAIGQAGWGSALSIAVAYTAVARGDGSVVAPRLIVDSGQPATRLVFNPTRERSEALENALEQPLGLGGTAVGVGVHALARANGYADVLLGKTGTFQVRQLIRRSTDTAANLLIECGTIDLTLTAPRQESWGRLLGAAICEDSGLAITAVHRYPHADVLIPQAATAANEARLAKEELTSFAGIIRPSVRSHGEGIVLAVVSDIEGAKAQIIARPLLDAAWDWLSR